MRDPQTRYRRFFSPARFFGKLARFGKTLGTKTVYTALLLYYAYERKDTPAWAKRTVLGALGYLIMPLDISPDLIPILGYTDDVGVLTIALGTVAVYVNAEVKTKAREKMNRWFPRVDNDEVAAVNRELSNPRGQ